MKKVFIIHGFEGSPNGGWRPWLMAELEKKDIYTSALAMPSPEKPLVKEWVAEIARHIMSGDEIYLVGHSLGVPAILRYLESPNVKKIAGAVLVSGPCLPIKHPRLKNFLNAPFDWKKIKSKSGSFAVIHGDNDPLVPLQEAKILSEKLNAKCIIIKNGGHLNGGSGWYALPQCLRALLQMMSLTKLRFPASLSKSR